MSEDPFFGLSEDSTWNACIGQQGDEFHYVEGYLEAASVARRLRFDLLLLDVRGISGPPAPGCRARISRATAVTPR